MPRGVLLDAAERQQIARGIDKKWTATAIAQKLGRHQSVISREINHNGGRDTECPIRAQQRPDRLSFPAATTQNWKATVVSTTR